MPTDGVVLTKAGGQLKCQYICHINARLPNCDKAWEKMIHRCLEVIDEKNLTSLAMPAVGTGKRIYRNHLTD